VLSILLFSAIGISSSADAIDKEKEKEKAKTAVVCGADNANCAVAATPCDSKNEACQTIREVNAVLRAMVIPEPPPPPPPPAPPEIVVPNQAHLACSGKSTGSTMTWRFEDKLRITGKCTVRDGKPWLDPEHISSKN
jgi:hypothetical protein